MNASNQIYESDLLGFCPEIMERKGYETTQIEHKTQCGSIFSFTMLITTTFLLLSLTHK